jgi:hypothetical protein
MSEGPLSNQRPFLFLLAVGSAFTRRKLSDIEICSQIMSIEFESFQPEKRTLGQILSSTSPPIRVPDFQRDFSWTVKEVGDFWSDLIAFGGNDPQANLTGKEYFLGATVLVNNGSYHLLLDGQQRLATSTILLAALRDKMHEYKPPAAEQIQDQYIVFEDHLTGERVSKIELNKFDRAFYRDYVQQFPRLADAKPLKKSHRLIVEAYEYFRERIEAGWKQAGDGKKGFDWSAHVTQTLREHVALVTVISNNERSASLIFATLNDRGIGLSTVDLIRSWVLQKAHPSKQEEILECWDSIFNAAGPAIAAETLLRISWVAQQGDVKTRTLYKVVSDSISTDGQALNYSRRLREDSLLYRQFRDGDTDDSDLQDLWLALRTLKFNAGYPLLLSASYKFGAEEQKSLARALVAVVIRHNIVCDRDRAKLESLVYGAAKNVSDNSGYDAALATLRSISPDDKDFAAGFAKLAFAKSEISIARYLLGAIEASMAKTQELSTAGPERVHVEHIYPLSPDGDVKWADHGVLVERFGNLTLLDRRLNEKIKNGQFTLKKDQAYKDSRLEITRALLGYDEWTPATVEERQQGLCARAMVIWPEGLV